MRVFFVGKRHAHCGDTKMKENASAVRSTKNDFDQNLSLQAACVTSIARVYCCSDG